MQREKQRRASFKASIDATKSRRNREQTQISIRKRKKEDRLSKRRRAGAPTDTIRIDGSDEDAVRQFPQMKAALLSGDPLLAFQALRFFRGLLSKENDPPVEEFLRAGLLPVFMQFLAGHDEKLYLSHFGPSRTWLLEQQSKRRPLRMLAHSRYLRGSVLLETLTSESKQSGLLAIWLAIASNCAISSLQVGLCQAIASSCTPDAPIFTVAHSNMDVVKLLSCKATARISIKSCH